MPGFGLALCHDDPQYDSTIDAYFPKKHAEDKPWICGLCTYFKASNYCRLNASYSIAYDTKSCNRALKIEDKSKHIFDW